MTDPVRWREPDSDAQGDVRELFASGGATPGMSAADHARTAARVAKVAAAASVASTSAWTWIKAMFLSVAIGVVGAGIVAVGMGHGHRMTAPPRRVQERPRAQALVRERQSADTEQQVPAPLVPIAVLPPQPVTPRASARRPESHLARPSDLDTPSESPVVEGGGGGTVAMAPNEDPLIAEQRVLAQAHSLIERDAEGALAQLDAHARLFPNGQLQAERELLRVMALVHLGRHDDARTVGDALVARFPGSIYVQRVEGILARDR